MRNAVRSFHLVIVSLVLLLGIMCPGAHSFTIEQVMSAPFPFTPVSDSDSLAWTLYEEGEENIWIASEPGFKPRKLTHYKAEDGQKLSSLVLSPDGATLVYIRGEGPMPLSGTNMVTAPGGSVGNYKTDKGMSPNPANNPKGAEQVIWAIPTKAGGEPWKLALGSSPVISPDSKTLLFSSQGQFWEVPLKPAEKGVMPTPKKLFDIEGVNTNPIWSPDGNSLLFVSERNTHNLIGVFNRIEQRFTWLMPAVFRDMSPVWSPDGKRVAFVRVPGKTKYELFDLTKDWPIAICVADVKTGRGREIWRTPAGKGGWAQWYPEYADGWFSDALRWTKNNRIVFYSEHQGWLHIYSTTPSGEKVIDLTEGAAEVWGSAVSPDGETLYFSTNRENSGFRHLWQVPTATGGSGTRITRGKIAASNPVMLKDGKALAFRMSKAKMPQTLMVMELGSGTTQVVSPAAQPKSFPEKELVVPEQVTFASDNFTIHGQLFMPRNAKPGDQLPAVIYVHGGPFRQMLPVWNYYGSYTKCYAMNQFLANHGYAVLSVNYRSGTGYGNAFRMAPHQGPRGSSEYRDVLNAAFYLMRRPEINPEKIGIWGNSCGGYLTALSLGRNSDIFKVGSALSGIYDYAYRATNMIEPGGEWGIKGKKGLALAYRSSPMSDLFFWKSPVLLVHGDGDREVIFGQTVDLAQGLEKRGVDMELLILPGEMHGYVLHENWIKTFKASKKLFDRVLKH